MRTTLTLDSDVARHLQATVRQRKVTFKEAVNTALRAGLAMETAPKAASRFRVRPHRGGFRAGIDPHRLNRLAEELEDEALLARPRLP